MDIKKSAVLSDDGKYRYELRREWGPKGAPVCAWIMLNPSTADADIDDPTIRRVIGFSKAWGYGSATVVNLFALRSTNPAALTAHHAPIGPENDDYIAKAIESAAMVVCAWGAHVSATMPSSYKYMDRGSHVFAMADAATIPVCLGTTKLGAPRHPLYVPAKTEPVVFEM